MRLLANVGEGIHSFKELEANPLDERQVLNLMGMMDPAAIQRTHLLVVPPASAELRDRGTFFKRLILKALFEKCEEAVESAREEVTALFTVRRMKPPYLFF